MEFSNTSTKDGLIQDCEHWTNLGDGVISGDATLKARFTGLINRAFDEVLPYIFSADAKWQWDDSNHSKNPTATTDLIAGQSSYTLVTDEDGNSVLEIQAAYIKDVQGTWRKLNGIDSPRDAYTDPYLSQNSNNTGTPGSYDKNGVSLSLDKIPDYSATGGLKVVFSRAPSYFASGDTTKKPGIPAIFHRLLSLIASYDWVLVNKGENTALITRLEGKITEQKAQLGAHMAKRSRDEKTVARAHVESSR
jgi:hypothetical protein